jgi:hypothetical protein
LQVAEHSAKQNVHYSKRVNKLKKIILSAKGRFKIRISRRNPTPAAAEAAALLRAKNTRTTNSECYLLYFYCVVFIQFDKPVN